MNEIQTNYDNTQQYSLVDLFVAIFKHRKLFIYTVCIVTFIGAIFAEIIHLKKQYIFRQPVQLASYYLDGKQFLLQGNQQVISAISNLYIPRFITEYKTAHPKFNEVSFIDAFSAQASFVTIQDQSQVQTNMLYLEFKGKINDLNTFQAATASIVQQIADQEQSMINSLLAASNANLKLLSAEVPKLEKVGDLLKSYSADPNSDVHQEMSMAVSTRETYLDLISQSQTAQNVIAFKQTINELNQKVTSLQPTSTAPMIIMNAKPKISSISIILLSFTVGIFIGLLLIFIKVISENIKTQFKSAR